MTVNVYVAVINMVPQETNLPLMEALKAVYFCHLWKCNEILILCVVSEKFETLIHKQTPECSHFHKIPSTGTLDKVTLK